MYWLTQYVILVLQCTCYETVHHCTKSIFRSRFSVDRRCVIIFCVHENVKLQQTAWLFPPSGATKFAWSWNNVKKRTLHGSIFSRRRNWKFNVWLVVDTEEAVIPYCNYSHLVVVINCRYEQAEVNAAFRFPIHPFIVRILNFMQGTIRLFKLVLRRWLVNIIIVDVNIYEQVTAGR